MGNKEQQQWKAAKSNVSTAMNADALVGICRGSRHQVLASHDTVQKNALRAQRRSESRQWRNGTPELGLHPTRSSRPGLWRSTGVVDKQCFLEA